MDLVVAVPGPQSTVLVLHGLSTCALRMWELPGPGRDPVSPALAGGFFATELPGKSWSIVD